LCAGIDATFVAGDIQQEAAAEEKNAQRIAEFEARLPELPPMPTQARLAALHAEQRDAAAAVAGQLAQGAGDGVTGPMGAAALPAAGRSSSGRPGELALLAAGPGTGGEIVLAGESASHGIEEGESCLFTDVGFYMTRCLPFLPTGAPEQHFATCGLKRPLSRAEWEAFVAAEKQADEAKAARKAEKRRARRRAVARNGEASGATADRAHAEPASPRSEDVRGDAQRRSSSIARTGSEHTERSKGHKRRHKREERSQRKRERSSVDTPPRSESSSRVRRLQRRQAEVSKRW
jgi:hypothetical protein